MSETWHSAKIIAGIISRRVLAGPHSVQVSIVDACNYRCVMCWEHSSEFEGWGADKLARAYHSGKQNKSTVMDLDLFKSFVTSLRNTGTRQLGLSGIGEPLLHKQLVEAVSFSKGLGMSVWITTNGSLLNPDLLRDLVSAGLDDLCISINAGAAAEYGLVHSNQDDSRFGQIVGSLSWLKEHKQKLGTELPRVSLSNVVSNLNSHRGLEMMETGVQVGACRVSYRPIDVFAGSERFALGAEDLGKLEMAFAEVRRLGSMHGIETNTETFNRLLELRAGEQIPSPCFAGWLYPFVLANGDVTYCCVSREVLGNLADSSFEDIWFSPSRKRLNDIALRIHQTQQPVPNSRCYGCEQMLANVRIYRRLWPLWGRPGSKAAAARSVKEASQPD